MAVPEQRLVFVDDEPHILSVLRRELHEWAEGRGLAIEGFTSAAAALESIASSPGNVALIVSDLRMPGMKGSDFLIAVNERWPGIPTILLSGYSEAEELMKAVRAGIRGFVLKPWDPDYLRCELEKALEFRRVMEKNAAYEKRIENELRWAGQFQRAFLRPSFVPTEGVEVLSTWRPVDELFCGGDYYDLIDLGKRRFLALVGDVAGHGIRAALVTGFLKAMIWAEYVSRAGPEAFSPAAFLAWLNDRICFELRQEEGAIVTFLAAVINTGSGEMRYANAGHCRPWLLRGGRPLELPLAGPALGFAEAVTFPEGSESIIPGDVIFLHSDGLVETGARDAADRPDSQADGVAQRPPGTAVPLATILAELPWGGDYNERMMARCLAVSGRVSFEDDVTMLSIRVLGTADPGEAGKV